MSSLLQDVTYQSLLLSRDMLSQTLALVFPRSLRAIHPLMVHSKALCPPPYSLETRQYLPHTPHTDGSTYAVSMRCCCKKNLSLESDWCPRERGLKSCQFCQCNRL